jgi:hypothetical protein
VLDAAAELALQDDAPDDELINARQRLEERRLAEAFLALDEAGTHGAPLDVIASCEAAILSPGAPSSRLV